MPENIPALVEAAEKLGYESGRSDTLHEGARAIEALMAWMLARVGDFQGDIKEQFNGVLASARVSAPRRTAPPIASPIKPLKRAETIVPKTEASDFSGQLTGPQSAVLGALAWWKAMNFDQPTRAQVAAKVGWKVNGSNLRNRLADLSSKGLIEYPAKGTVRMTAAGADAAPAPELGTSLIDSIKAHLTGPQNTVFDVLIAAEGPMSRADLGAAVGWEPTGSNLRNRLADLSTLELIHYPGKGFVELQEWVQ